MRDSQIFEQEIRSATERIDQMMFESLAYAGVTEPMAQSKEAAQMIVGEVSLDGAWQGTIFVTVPEQFAMLLAAHVFQLPKEQLSKEQIEDTVKELANMTGGNLKNVVPSPSKLSLPKVTYVQQLSELTDRKKPKLEIWLDRLGGKYGVVVQQ